MATRKHLDHHTSNDAAIPVADAGDLDRLLNGTAGTPSASCPTPSAEAAAAQKTEMSFELTRCEKADQTVRDTDTQELMDLIAQAPDSETAPTVAESPDRSPRDHSVPCSGAGDTATAVLRKLTTDSTRSNPDLQLLRQRSLAARKTQQRLWHALLATAILAVAVVGFGIVPGLFARTQPLRSVSAAAVSPDSSTVAVLRRRGPAEIWNLGTGKQISRAEVDSGSTQLAFTDDHNLLIFGRRGLYEWKTRLDPSGDSLRSISTKSTAVAGRIVPTGAPGQICIVAGDTVSIFDVRSRTVVRSANLVRRLSSVMAVSSDSGLVAAGTHDGGVDFISTEDGRYISSLNSLALSGKSRNAPTVTGIAFSDDGRTMAISLTSGHIQLWDIETASLLSKVQHSPAARHLIFDSANDALIAGSKGRIVVLRDQLRNSNIIEAKGMDSPAWMELAADGHTLVAYGSDDRGLWVFDLKDNVVRHRLNPE